MKRVMRLLLFLASAVGVLFVSCKDKQVSAPQPGGNQQMQSLYKSQDSESTGSCNHPNSEAALSRQSAAIALTDQGWNTFSSTTDCVTGWADDTWNLTLTQAFTLTISADDCCCPGDYFEVYIDDVLIGTTPNNAPPWGCGFSGTLSSGSFSKTLCPGTYKITVRDAGFDGHSQQEISAQSMCPAGFTVSGVLSSPVENASALMVTDMHGKIRQPRKPSSSQGSYLKVTLPPVDELQALMNSLEPFVVINANGSQTFLKDEARKAGLSDLAIKIGKKIVKINNRIMLGDLPSLPPDDVDFIDYLFRQMPVVQSAAGCGNFVNPAPCPERLPSGRFFCTEDEVKQYLVNNGYHPTADYAGGNPSDFTKEVSNSCGAKTFRNHAIIGKIVDSEYWTYSVQNSEPNPEIRGYAWPNFWWAAYVAWWHVYSC